jgi:Domain of unknown function (DUF4383)
MPTHHPPHALDRRPAIPGIPGRTWVQRAARVVGVLFLLIGVLGFIPGVTADRHSGVALFGVFTVSTLLNVAHLTFGVVGVVMSRTFGAARGFLIGGGLIFLTLFFVGVSVYRQTPMDFVPVNDADNWLHLGLGLGMLALGITLGRNPYAKDRR